MPKAVNAVPTPPGGAPAMPTPPGVPTAPVAPPPMPPLAAPAPAPAPVAVAAPAPVAAPVAPQPAEVAAQFAPAPDAGVQQIAAVQPAPAPVAAPPVAPAVAPPLAPQPAAPVAAPAPAPVAEPAPIQAVVPPMVAPPAAAPPQMGASIAQQMQAAQAANPGAFGNILGGFDMSGVETSNFRLLDNSLEYEAIITKAEIKPAANGTKQIALSMKITWNSGPNAGQYRGVSINDYLALTEKAMWRFKSLCSACDLLTPDGARFAGQDVSDFVDYIVAFRVKDSEWEGVTRTKVAGTYSAGAFSPELTGAPVA